MIQRLLVLAGGIVLATASIGLAQPREPLPRFVFDARAGSVGFPTSEGWTPALPVDSQVPARKLGFEAGAHVFPFRFGVSALGIGATFLYGRGTFTPPPPVPPAQPQFPDVTTKLSALSPQLSFNFGHRLGWSSIGAGIGRIRVQSEATATSRTSVPVPADSDWVQTIHFGGGARWFVNDHVGVGFDIRFYMLPNVPATGAPKTRLFMATAGIALK